MLGGHEVDVVTPALLKLQHQLSDFLGGAGAAGILLGQIPVLAEHALQIAVAEEDGARSSPPAQAVLLTVVRERRGDDGAPARVADAPFVGEAIDVTITGTRTTVTKLS